jgi:hypothetical protein
MDKLKTFKKILEKSNTNRVIILTNHYQILGNVYECEECNKEEFINLVNVRLCSINDVYDGICEADTHYDWLHINMDKVVGFSFVKN